MTRVITVTGGKGGVGKTNVSINLALILSRLGSKVCLFDADLGLANINILLGLYPEYDLEDVILSNKSIQDIIIKNYQGIDIIPGSSGVEKLANLSQESIDHLIESFSAIDDYDYFIFDTSAGISRNVISFCLAASDVVLVITPEPTSLTDAYALLKVLCFNGFTGSVKVVVNQCKNTSVASTAYNKLRDVVQKYLTLNILPLGIIVQDKRLPEAVQKQQPLVVLYPQASASKCINVIATRLVAQEPENFNTSGITAFWARFLEIAKNPLKIPEKRPQQKNVSDAYKPEPETSGTQIMKKEGAEAREQPVVNAGSLPAEPEKAPENNSTVSENSSAVRVDMAKKSLLPASDTTAAQALFDKMEFAVNLPTLPHILLKLIETCSREDVNMKDLAKIVEKDPSLSTKILRMVNSSYYSFSQKVSNFNQALSLLGIDTIRGIAISASVYQVFGGLKGTDCFNLKQFWRHSLMCAVLSNLIAKKNSYARPDEAFLSGLLHDIGKLVLLKNYPDQYVEIITESAINAHMVFQEQEKLGITHCETGARLINHWHLQSFIADAIRYHHEPVSRILDALPLVRIVYTANALCSETPGDIAAHYETAEKVFSFKQADIADLIKQAEEQVAQIARSLDIDIETKKDPESFCSEKDKEIQAYLTGQIRDISLLQGTLQNFVNACDAEAILQVACRGLQILFDINNVLFFLYDESQNILAGKSPNAAAHHDMINDLIIPCQDGKSMLVAALRQSRVINSFAYRSEYALTIIDEQVIRLMGKEGIVCLPMVVRKQYVGAVVFPLDRASLVQANGQMKLLHMFINHAALALDSENIRQTQAKRVLTERMAASTAIARKVAHEVNNPLSIIKNYLKIFELRLSDQNIPIDDLSIINEEIDRVALIIDDLSDFSRPKIENLETVQVNDLLGNLVKITRDSFLKSNIHIHLTPDALLPPLISDKNGLKQVFINLIKNASEALKNGGNILIETKYAADPGFAEIIIRDDGPGLPEAMQSRLFEPYTSTKGEGHAGLGLSVVYSMLQELQGSITCTTGEGKGTSFSIRLPVFSSKT